MLHFLRGLICPKYKRDEPSKVNIPQRRATLKPAQSLCYVNSIAKKQPIAKRCMDNWRIKSSPWVLPLKRKRLAIKRGKRCLDAPSAFEHQSCFYPFLPARLKVLAGKWKNSARIIQPFLKSAFAVKSIKNVFPERSPMRLRRGCAKRLV